MVVDLFMRVKNVRLFLLLRQGAYHISDLAKKTDVTYLHARDVVNMLEEAGLVKTEKKGRKRLVSLTERGEEVAIALEAAYRQLTK